jgi:Lrp/AsnC family leucine-responsive transcriptional regulator
MDYSSNRENIPGKALDSERDDRQKKTGRSKQRSRKAPAESSEIEKDLPSGQTPLWESEQPADLDEKELDPIDRKIIRILLKNARTPVKEIASQVFLSSPAVSARIDKLEKAGIIRGFHAEVDYHRFGYHIKAFINLEVAPNQKQEFYPYIQGIDNVVECNCVTGDYSMLIETVFQTTEQLDHFINELQHFGKTKTLIAFSTSVEHRDVPI